jgi:hypothetical protein
VITQPPSPPPSQVLSRHAPCHRWMRLCSWRIGTVAPHTHSHPGVWGMARSHVARLAVLAGHGEARPVPAARSDYTSIKALVKWYPLSMYALCLFQHFPASRKSGVLLCILELVDCVRRRAHVTQVHDGQVKVVARSPKSLTPWGSWRWAGRMCQYASQVQGCRYRGGREDWVCAPSPSLPREGTY